MLNKTETQLLFDLRNQMTGLLKILSDLELKDITVNFSVSDSHSDLRIADIVKRQIISAYDIEKAQTEWGIK